MRRVIWLGAIFALLWSGWWLFAAFTMRAGLEQWFQDRRAEGWQAETVQIGVAGYPLALNATLERPTVADPETGVAFETSRLDISTPAWWPGNVTLAFPEDALVFASPEGQRAITAAQAIAALHLHPGAALEVAEMTLTAGPWSLDAPEGSVMAAQGVTLRMRQDDQNARLYAFDFTAPAFRPGSLPREAFRVPSDWPIDFDRLVLEMRVGFDRPFDRTTLEDARPQPRRIDLEVAEAVWGRLSLRSAAALDVSDRGALTGEVSLQARNWREMLSLAETAGVLPEALRPQVESILGALARGSGNPDTIDVTLALRDGQMYLGFIPLGPAPLLILH